jgi:hypothetical protein
VPWKERYRIHSFSGQRDICVCSYKYYVQAGSVNASFLKAISLFPAGMSLAAREFNRRENNTLI